MTATPAATAAAMAATSSHRGPDCDRPVRRGIASREHPNRGQPKRSRNNNPTRYEGARHRLRKETMKRCSAIFAVLLGAGCADVTWGPEQLGQGKGSTRVASLEQGRKTYATYCIGCHGEAGDGNGVAARFLNPKPRDFRIGRLKFASVAAGSAPRDEDYLRSINRGLA